MNKGVGMEDLEGECGQQGIIRYSIDRFASRQAKNGAEPLASGKDAVSHGFMKNGRALVLGRQVHIERGFDKGALFLDVWLEIEHVKM